MEMIKNGDKVRIRQTAVGKVIYTKEENGITYYGVQSTSGDARLRWYTAEKLILLPRERNPHDFMSNSNLFLSFKNPSA